MPRRVAAPTTRHEVEIRPARREDLPACARLGARLSRMHHRLDPARFFTVPDLEAGYRWWLAKERRSRKAVVLVAVRRKAAGREVVVGYAYGRLEARDWNTLREACGVGVDLIVLPPWRRRGVGARLVEALAAALGALGAPRLVIQVAARNPRAAKTFAGLGFRPTMLELAMELGRKLPPKSPVTRRRRSGAVRSR